MRIAPVSLLGRNVILRPPNMGDIEGLRAAVQDGELWKSRVTFIPSPGEMQSYVRNLVEQSAIATSVATAATIFNSDDVNKMKMMATTLPFVTVYKPSNTIVGSTRYINIDYESPRLEIGNTWIAKSWQRTMINTEAKFLMLRHAFEHIGCIAVEIRTDILNTTSRRAIERLGAKQDGILRSHKVMPDGRIRDTVCYSITAEEWRGRTGEGIDDEESGEERGVKARLIEKVNR